MTPHHRAAAWLNTAGLFLCLGAGCTSLTAEQRVLSRMAQALPSRWPHPVPVGRAAGLELDPDKLTASEAQALLPHCRAAVKRGLGQPVVDAAEDAPWRVVVSRVVVDVGQQGRGARITRVKAVAELRLHDRPAAVAQGTAWVRNPRPVFRADGVDVGDVQRAVASACERAARALAEVPKAPPGDVLVRARAALVSGDAPARAEACRVLGETLLEEDAARVLEQLHHPDNTTRRLCVWAVGQLGHEPALDALAHTAETDVDYGVRVEAVAALNRLLWVNPALKGAIRAARASAAAEQVGRTPEVPAEEPEDSPSRVLVVP